MPRRQPRARRRIVDQYAGRPHVLVFADKDGTLWYDIPFAYDPYYQKAC